MIVGGEFCLECGGRCCTVLTVTRTDIERIRHLGYTTKSFVEKGGIPGSKLHWMKRREGKCVFLVDKRCSIYYHRPEVCKNYACSELRHHGHNLTHTLPWW